MSANEHLNPDQFPEEHKWVAHPDRYGSRTEYSNTPHGGYVVDGNGYGRMKWTVQYPDGDYAMTDTKGEARANADLDLRQRNERARRKAAGGS